MPKTRSRRGCDTCRKRHIKCDEHLPICWRCEESHRRCTGRPLISQWEDGRVFEDKEANGNGRNWLQIPERLTFVTENIDAAVPASEAAQDESDDESSPTDDQVPDVHNEWDAPLANRSVSAFPQPPIPECSQKPADLGTSDALVDETSMPTFGITRPEEFFPPDETISGTSLALFNEHGSLSPTTPSTSIRRRVLNDRVEAMLLQHFAKELACWFDVTDPYGYFQVVVPERAFESEVLLNAIFAIAALHLNRSPRKESVEGSSLPVDTVLAEVYHTRCVGMLISLITDENLATTEDVLAAAVILRKFEEMNGYVTQQDSGNHLLGVSALFNSRTCAVTGGLAEAAFWQFVRQDAYMSLFIQQPPRIDFSKQHFHFSLSEAPDNVWANRIIFSTVMILTYCFTEQTESPAHWEDLNSQVTAWDARKPISFTPIFYEEASMHSGKFWPEIRFCTSWHATGTQYFHLCKILLSLYKPDLPAPGAGLRYTRAHKAMKEAVMLHARAVCGIAYSNHFVNPKFNLCPIMHMCGGWFAEVNEQRAILELLQSTENAHGWPTKYVRDSLREHWDME
ncbi:uncharacterized protein PV07_10837 [Cladophialophora immunda]|uniref:Zn(2)-C6 fungal-type domain-containing protein n=1 Tax=Cladophialophora immunda TaxID=569365 RepID=A0A0D2AJU4_9EURO|nr:uncharacterized protein PV07_10837 [Cladophialophora immunda]KIW25177.1 hypothetical protein PV07_10837 [Cladophialophora immunda]